MLEINEKVNEWKTRKKPEILKKYKKNDEIGKHLTKSKKELDYQYYKCDYCGNEIIIEKDINKRNGGLAEIPQTLTMESSVLEVALHDRCLNPLISELEKRLENRRQKQNDYIRNRNI